MSEMDFYFPEESPRRGTVSDFHEWVWAKYDERMQERLFYREHPELKPPAEFQNRERVIKSKLAHGKLQHYQLQYSKHYLRDFLGNSLDISEWIPIYIDKHDNSTGILEAPDLLVDEKAIRGCPDLVFKNSKSNQVLIVENKITWVPLGYLKKDGYPNVRAQLWCYSWMSSWASLKDKEVLMGATFWDVDLNENFRTKTWSRDDIRLNLECKDWFEEYGGRLSNIALESCTWPP